MGVKIAAQKILNNLSQTREGDLPAQRSQDANYNRTIDNCTPQTWVSKLPMWGSCKRITLPSTYRPLPLPASRGRYTWCQELHFLDIDFVFYPLCSFNGWVPFYISIKSLHILDLVWVSAMYYLFHLN